MGVGPLQEVVAHGVWTVSIDEGHLFSDYQQTSHINGRKICRVSVSPGII